MELFHDGVDAEEDAIQLLMFPVSQGLRIHSFWFCFELMLLHGIIKSMSSQPAPLLPPYL